MLALAVAQLWPLAGPARLPQNLDLMLQYVPNAAYLARSLGGWRVPLWNPYLGSGMPFAADPGTGTWYLPSWPLLLLLPLLDAVRTTLWLHLLWAVGGVYALARLELRLAPPAAALAGAAFGLTTWLPGLTGMPVVLTAVAWLPWVLLLGARAARGQWHSITPLAGAGALQLLAGWPAGAYLTWLTLGALVLLRGVEGRPRVVALVRVGAAAALATLLAGVLLVPAAEFVRETSYGETRPLAAVASQGYLTLLSWLRPASGTGSVESSQLYLGVVPLLLALVALLPVATRRSAVGGRRLALSRPPNETLALAAIAIGALVLAAGTHAPLFAVLYRWLPGFRIVFLPARLGIVAALALACLAGIGLERAGRGVSWRECTAAATAAAGLVPLTLLQFWWSEGYDDFRRLLTNVGRFAGGPFLSRAQEAHYVAFGALGLVALAVAARRPRVAAAALVALSATDLALAQREAAPAAFDPAAWYAQVERTAAGAAVALGHDRLAGLQWHGTHHFLAAFPANAEPALLPPNLALMAGVRDAQAYNPLLLRREAAYFSRVAGPSAGDDHWLWLSDFAAPEVNALAVRRVLTDGADWRVTGHEAAPAAPGDALLPAGAAQRYCCVPADEEIAALRVVSYLGEAAAVRQDTPAIEVRVLRPDGETLTFVLHAGVDTAEWAYGRLDVRTAARHRQAPIALETPLVSATGGTYSVYEYLATIALPAGTRVAAIEARSLLATGRAYVQGVWAEPAAAPFTAAPGGLENGAALSRFRVAGGAADALRDDPEAIVLRVSTPAPGTLVVADAFYPGWTASVDGAAVPLRPEDQLFRAISVPAGTHEVRMIYRPLSLLVGLACTAFGAALAAGMTIGRHIVARMVHSDRSAEPKRRDKWVKSM